MFGVERAATAARRSDLFNINSRLSANWYFKRIFSGNQYNSLQVNRHKWRDIPFCALVRLLVFFCFVYLLTTLLGNFIWQESNKIKNVCF